MAIYFITGVPGAGKTFYAVNHLVKNYCYYDRQSRAYRLKDKYTLISNIEELALNHKNLKEILEDNKMSIESFFRKDFQEKISKKYKNIIYFLDEAQQHFHRRFYDKESFFYFQYHRHLGHNIYLITQDRSLLPKEINTLCESEIRAVKRSLSVFGEFKYNVLSNKEIIDRKVLKKNERVFELYKSQQNEESEKIKNPLVKYLVAILIFGIFSLVMFKNYFLKSTDNNMVQEAVASQSVPRANSKPKSPGPLYKYIPVSHAIANKRLYIFNQDTNELVSARAFPYKIKIIPGISSLKVYALMPFPDETQK
jgi:zona occludens toxin